MGLKKTQEREFARVLFVSENLSQKDISERVGITEKTLAKWIVEGDWKKLKKSLLNTRKSNLSLLYDQLDWLNNHIATRKPIYAAPPNLIDVVKSVTPEGTIKETFVSVKAEEYPLLLGNAASSKEADSLLKLSAAINRLEFETGIGETVEVARKVIEFARQNNIGDTKDLTAIFDVYIQTLLK